MLLMYLYGEGLVSCKNVPKHGRMIPSVTNSPLADASTWYDSFLLAATSYQRNQNLWNILYQLTDAFSIHMCCWNVATYERYEWKITMGKLKFIKISLLTGPHCQFLGVGQGMKQT